MIADNWYMIAATFKSSATQEAKINIKHAVSSTPFTTSIDYPRNTSFPGTRLQLFTNGIAQLIDPNTTDLPLSQTRGDTGDFHGFVRDIRIWREKILTQTEITNFHNNKVSIANVGFGQSHIAGFVFSPPQT